MSSATLDVDSIASDEVTHEYRALHTGAIIGLLLGIASVFMVITAASTLEGCLLVAPIPVLGIFISFRSLAKIRREPESYTGRPIAALGLALSLFFLVTGLGYGGYVYATEVPDGYERISFNGMKPDEAQERSNIFIPPEIKALDGRKVFIKGYIRPDSVTQKIHIKELLLVRDNNQCCFGDITKIKFYDQIYVNLIGSLAVDYVEGAIYRMGGTLHINEQNLARGPKYPVFTLQADYAN
jgi:hypothetical protein